MIVYPRLLALKMMKVVLQSPNTCLRNTVLLTTQNLVLLLKVTFTPSDTSQLTSSLNNLNGICKASHFLKNFLCRLCFYLHLTHFPLGNIHRQDRKILYNY